MDAYEEGIRRLQGELDNLRQLIPRIGDGESQLVPPPHNPNLRIAGAEVTQGIQYYDQGSGGQAANSLRLVEGKTTVLRVELDVTNRNPNYHLPTKVTGEIIYPGVEPGSPDSSPINAPIAARARGLYDRGNADHTLNFRVQGSRCTGSFTPRVRLYDPANPGGGPQNRNPLFTGLWSNTNQLTFPRLRIPFVETEITDYRLRLVCVRIKYTGPDQNGNPMPMPIGPLQAYEVEGALKDSLVTGMFPVSAINFTGFPEATFGEPMNVAAGWNALVRMLQDMRSAASSNDVYLGVLPDGVPTPPDKSGQSDLNGAAVAFLSQPLVAAHELCHAYGRWHAPCGDPDGVDPYYPTCGTLPAGSICEFGFDTKTSKVYDPNTTVDFIPSKNCPIEEQWISPYTFRGLFYNIHWPVAGRAFGTAAVDREYLYLNFRMHRNGTVHLLPSFHLSGLVAEDERGPRSPVAFELRDAKGQVIGFHRCPLTDPHADPDGPYYDFHKLVPWETETRSIGFLRDGEEVAEVEIEEKEPQITAGPVSKPNDRENRVRLEWKAKNGTKALTYLVRYSNNGGESWLGLAAGLTEPSLEVDLESLPGGERCVFQVGASSPVRTTVAETEPFSVPVKTRRPYIVSPEPGSTFLQGEPVSLAGAGYSPDFETTPLDEAAWSSNVAGFLGYGHEVITEALAPGTHKITLSVEDGLGGEASADVLIKINPKEEG